MKKNYGSIIGFRRNLINSFEQSDKTNKHRPLSGSNTQPINLPRTLPMSTLYHKEKGGG